MAPPFLFTKVKITIRKVERVDRIGKTTFQEEMNFSENMLQPD